jgi:hypothetical protein
MAGNLTDRLATIVDRYVYAGGTHGHHDAAVRILADDTIRHALAAADVVADLDREHQPVAWAVGSDVVVCTCGRGAHPCPDRVILDRLLADRMSAP